MNQDTALKIISLQEQLLEREEYRCLLEEYRRCDGALLEMLAGLEESRQRAVWDFLGVGIELHLLLLTAALEGE